MKKPLRALLLALTLALAFALPAAANGPVPSQEAVITVHNCPEGAYYLELLMPEQYIVEDYYTDYDPSVVRAEGLSVDSEIVSYSVSSAGETLFSLAVHDETEFFAYLYPDAGEDGAKTAVDSQTRGSEGGWFRYCGEDYLKCFAVLSETGEVLAVSELFTALPYANTYLIKADYDAATGIVTAGEPEEEEMTGGQLLLSILLIPLICIVTVLVEVLVALPFKVRPKRFIALITALTNLVMNISILSIGYRVGRRWPYDAVIVAFELLAVIVEYLIYSRIVKDASKGRILAYTIVANIASFLVCAILNFALWFA